MKEKGENPPRNRRVVGLTPAQADVLELVTIYCYRDEYLKMSNREIAEVLGLSRHTVEGIIPKLAKMGMIKIHWNTSMRLISLPEE